MPSETDKLEKGMNYLIGQVMKATGGKADPLLVRKILLDMLDTTISEQNNSVTIDKQTK